MTKCASPSLGEIKKFFLYDSTYLKFLYVSFFTKAVTIEDAYDGLIVFRKVSRTRGRAKINAATCALITSTGISSKRYKREKGRVERKGGAKGCPQGEKKRTVSLHPQFCSDTRQRAYAEGRPMLVGAALTFVRSCTLFSCEERVRIILRKEPERRPLSLSLSLSPPSLPPSKARVYIKLHKTR